MPIGTASNKLRRSIMFDLIKRLDFHWCYQCGGEIEYVEDFSIEHKTPWLDSENPLDLFFDLDNIWFSHKSCNSGAARNSHRKKPCPTPSAYRRGCRCEPCVNLKRNYDREYRERKKNEGFKKIKNKWEVQ